MSTSATLVEKQTHRSQSESFHVGEHVLARGRRGVVVGKIETGEYADMFKPHSWVALAAGTLVQWDDGTLTHYREPWFSLQHSA
jgi:hypothetical protein